MPAVPTSAQSYPAKVFLCHGSGDKPAVRKLYRRLNSDGFRPWLDAEELIGGQRWEIEIRKAVRESDVVLVCLSERSASKEGFVQKEIRFALDRADEKPDGTIYVIPVRLEECEIPERLAQWHWVNLYEDSGYGKLLTALRLRASQIQRAGGAPHPPPPAPVERTAPPDGEEHHAIPVQQPQGPSAATARAKRVRWSLALAAFGVLVAMLVWWAVRTKGGPAAAISTKQEPPAVIPSAPHAGETKPNSRDGLTYVWIPLGDFMMGCSKDAGGKDDPECYDDEKPAHPVKISKGFWIGQTEVTVAAYEKFRMDKNKPELPKEDSPGRKLNTAAGDASLPAVEVTWDQAQGYCEWAGGLRLPWEAEWEYAARAGDTRPRYGELDAIAWYGDNSGRSHINSTQWWNEDQSNYGERLFKNGNGPHPVAERPNSHNAWNLYDMLGNVWEWVADRYDEKYYLLKVSPDPHGPDTGEKRVLRGGSWSNYPRVVRVSDRYGDEPSNRGNDIGFRCAGELR